MLFSLVCFNCGNLFVTTFKFQCKHEGDEVKTLNRIKDSKLVFTKNFKSTSF